MGGEGEGGVLAFGGVWVVRFLGTVFTISYLGRLETWRIGIAESET